MGEGNGNGKAPVLGCGMSVLQKNYSWRKGSFLVYDPTFYHLCFSESWIRMFFWSPAFFFRNPAEALFSSQRRIQVYMHVYYWCLVYE